MPTIPELLRDQVSLDIKCIDRVYLNGYVPRLQTSGALAYFPERHRGGQIASPALLGKIGDALDAAVKAYAQAHHIPVVGFANGQRKDDMAAAYRRRYKAAEGNIGEAHELSILAAVGVRQGLLLLPAGRGLRAGLHQSRKVCARSVEGMPEWA